MDLYCPPQFCRYIDVAIIKRNVLFVDDDQVAQTLVTSMLTQAGYVVTCVSDGFEGIDLIHRYPFDIVLLDIVMGQMNGLELLKRLKTNPETKEVPVIMLSARYDKLTVMKAQQLGAADYLVKPPDRDVFLKKLENILGGRPRFAEIFVAENSKRSRCEYGFSGKVLSVGEAGLTLTSEIPLAVNKFHEINAEILKDIGVQTTRFKVVHCQQETDHYIIYVNFIGVKVAEVIAIRQWVIEHALKGRTVA